MERMELRDEKLRVSSVDSHSSATGRRRRLDEPRHENDKNQDHPSRMKALRQPRNSSTSWW